MISQQQWARISKALSGRTRQLNADLIEMVSELVDEVAELEHKLAKAKSIVGKEVESE